MTDGFREVEYDDFEWNTEEIVIKEQPATAIYFNERRQVVIRQRDTQRDMQPGDDQFVFFSLESLPALVDALDPYLLQAAGISPTAPPGSLEEKAGRVITRRDPTGAERQRRLRERRRNAPSNDARTVTDRDAAE